ncbi:L-proline glycine betaine ABC transport system permease protein ProW [Caenispirillum salinarum AK4]|uniref:L-proline glycine betaine ABC transport system permease protein ProW n=1 Tax=Caenispirillum salinarum AK4 TaxID=1238182 RepID=K9H2Q3_9PROT|nr:ABC transporter permease [Caenispirillum salinarum]EKV31867.1 L-proline glycine betaine ABC transport system permease protein ProW [Caenispirillum salinarum AK4]
MTTAVIAFRRAPGLRHLLTLLLVFALGMGVQASGLVTDIMDYWGDIVFLSQQHMVLVLVSGGLAIVTGVSLGILLSRPAMRRWAEAVMQVLNIGTTIPTLAVLALSMTLLGLGFTPAVFGLWLATLLPITRNTYQGLLAVPPALKEAATGMGMGSGRMLLKVELPNALFVIFAGIRTALAVNVGTVPLAFLIGGGGLGELIFTGIDLAEPGMMLAGAIPTALLAILVDFLVGQGQMWLIPRGVNPLR